MTVYRDSQGRTLADYPRPSVAVDTAVLTVDTAERVPSLHVLVVRREGRGRTAWALPGTFLHEDETLADAVRRSLRSKAGVTGLEPAQLHVLDALRRDDRGRVLSVAHLDTAPFEQLAASAAERDDVRLVPAADRPRLAFDHDRIVDLAVERLRAEYAEHPDPRRFLRGPFTLAQLQRVHEAVAGESFQKDTFRRSMEGLLRETDSWTSGSVGRPARLFQRY